MARLQRLRTHGVFYRRGVAAADQPQHGTPIDLLVLHGVRCTGFAELARIADATGLAEADAESVLVDLGAAGLVRHVNGAFGGWGITDEGRDAVAARIVDDVRRSGAEAAIAGAYESFLVLNPELLDICTAWQTRDIHGTVGLNDHRDKAYDAAVLARLVDLDGRADAMLLALGAAVPRFSRYRARLEVALFRAIGGDVASVADATDSYHTVWFQLHEDLLVSQGLSRD